MSIYADPIFVQAEVDYRREALTAGLPTARRAGRHHAGEIRAALRGLRGTGRRTGHGRHTPRAA